MESRNPELLPPPPGAVNALVNGFNAVANNVGVILLPALLDVFLWLGPQLKAKALVAPVLELARQMPPTAETQTMTNALIEFANGFNLFAILRTYPVGIFSLMTTNLSIQTPLGNRLQLDTSTWFISFLLVLALTFAGWLGGSTYYRVVAGIVFKEKSPGIFRSMFQSVLLSGLWMGFFVIANLPILIIIGILGLFNSVIRTIILVLLSIPFSWFLIGVFYSAHGIFSNTQNAFRSVWNSFRMVRYSLPNVGWFSMLVIVLSQGMDMLWHIPPANSWMTLVGILGHAFISTSLLAASFFYYRDINLWIESALQWLKSNHTSSARA